MNRGNDALTAFFAGVVLIFFGGLLFVGCMSLFDN
jgi:hypothetical protein